MRRVLPVAFLLATVFGGGAPRAGAHEDRIINLHGNKLIGLPARYSPAEFDTKNLRLTIGKNSKELSPWLKGFFELPHDLEFSASWYHQPSSELPYYLLITISPKQKDFRYGILVALDTLDLLRVYVDVI